MIHLSKACRRSLLLSPVLGLLVAPALGPGRASAAYVDCRGAATAVDQQDPLTLAYSLRCNSDIKGYSIVATQPLDSFSTETVVADQTGAVQSKESFGCEGLIPGRGFACNGSMIALHDVRGQFSTELVPCADPKHPVRLVFMVLANDLQSDGTRPLKLSQPFPMRTAACPRTKATRKTAKKPRKHVKH